MCKQKIQRLDFVKDYAARNYTTPIKIQKNGDI